MCGIALLEAGCAERGGGGGAERGHAEVLCKVSLKRGDACFFPNYGARRASFGVPRSEELTSWSRQRFLRQGGVTCQGTVTFSLQGEHWRLALGFSICTAISICLPKRSPWV